MMKISFFKNESYFYPPSTRISYFWKNAEQVKFNKNIVETRKIYLSIFNWVFIILSCCFISASIILFHVKNFWIVTLIIPFTILPLHELCHVFYARIIKKKVIGIRFFPYNYGFTWLKPGAYVKLDFCAMKKDEMILFVAFPLIFLTFLPLLLAIFIPSIRVFLIYTAFINVGTSIFDLFDITQILRVPLNAVNFFQCGWLMPISDQPISIHRMEKISDEDKLLHEQWLFANHQLTKVEEPEIDESALRFLGEFQTQFGANCHL